MSKKKHVYNQRWKIISTIDDKSGQAFIYKVSDITGEYKGEFALKRIKNVKREERYNNEVAACLKLRHENVIEIIEHFKEEDCLCMVFPYYIMGNLETYIHEKDLVLDKIIEFALQIANALNNAHESGIIHRDIKPQNILVKDDDTVIVGDFGICLIEDKTRNTMTFENVGARWYMAPELEEWGQLDVTPSADIYSLGKVIYFMLTKKFLPREYHRKEKYNIFKDCDNQVKELGLLLDFMICEKEIRIQTIEKVIGSLKNIQLIPDNYGYNKFIHGFTALKDREAIKELVENNKNVVIQKSEEKMYNFLTVYHAFLENEFIIIKEKFNSINNNYLELDFELKYTFTSENFSLGGVNLPYYSVFKIKLDQKVTQLGQYLNLVICWEPQYNYENITEEIQMIKEGDIDIFLVPIYQKQNETILFLSRDCSNTDELLIKQSTKDNTNKLYLKFKLSEWSAVKKKNTEFIKSSLDCFLKIVNNNLY